MDVAFKTRAAIRFGFGLRPGEAAASDGDAVLAQLGRAGETPPSSVGGPDMGERARLISDLRDLRKSGASPDKLRAARYKIRDLLRDDIHRLIKHTVESPNGFGERWMMFWANHFSVSARNLALRAVVGRYAPDAIRPYMAYRFGLLLTAAATHPAMLLYLDQAQSMGPNSRAGVRRGRGLNENFARELLELHTVGAKGGYTQKDVRQLAELLTGLGIDRRRGTFRFFPNRAEPGAERVLGAEYGGEWRASFADIAAFFEDVAVRPETASHLAGKITAHFTSDQPDAKLVEHLASRWRATRGDLRAVAAALIEHPAAHASFGAKAKTPFDFIVSTLRAADAPPAATETPAKGMNRFSARPLRALGQSPYRAPSPAGWSEKAGDWITPPGLAGRLRYASLVARKLTKNVDPRRFLQGALADAARPKTKFLVTGAAERWEGVALTLASPEFNRR
ncbi:MAG: DUF1800 domain-containing protein [Neomegalonema sp.]|nr:DUF1800 domain-containing protein [Neomegalonema sp.]